MNNINEDKINEIEESGKERNREEGKNKRIYNIEEM